ncbi:MAG: hypothetical protein Q9170_000490 [Blastenia crenularia]
MYYASRTLPNFFAFGLVTIALARLLPTYTAFAVSQARDPQVFLTIVTATGVIFRSELALLLAPYTVLLLLRRRLNITSAIVSGLFGAAIGLSFTLPIDSTFWQRFPLWPELSAFSYNILHSQSLNWGTSPWYFYFTSALLRLLFNPSTYIICIPLAASQPALRRPVTELVLPNLLFVALYSIQPHKEWRFIIYVIPPLLTAAALGANWIWTRRAKAAVYSFLSIVLVASVIVSFPASAFMLAVSRLNYPGAEALNRLHMLVPQHYAQYPNEYQTAVVDVHMDTLACMTGVTRFLQLPPPPLPDTSTLEKNKTSDLFWIYDKTEDEENLLDPLFWERFDWVLAERPERVIGRWEIVETVEGYAGLRILKPGDKHGIDVGAERGIGDVWSPVKGQDWKGIMEMVERLGKMVTRGWWIGLRIEPRIWILRREREVVRMGMSGDCPATIESGSLGVDLYLLWVASPQQGKKGKPPSNLERLGVHQKSHEACPDLAPKLPIHAGMKLISRLTMTSPTVAGQRPALSKSMPGSRSNSPGAPSRRIQKLNSYLSKLASKSSENLLRTTAPLDNTMEPIHTTNIRRWDGARRTTTNWDSIRRDPELWFPSGDCLVHLYAQGQSRRGASLRVSLAAMESSNCGQLLDRFSAKANTESPSSASDRSSSSDEDYFNDPSPPAKHELFIPAPPGLTKEGSFRYHLTTRNFFAWMFEKPLVGHRLGDSLLSLLDRMNEFRVDEDENLEEILAYLDSQEYTDFRSCPDHALAVLQFAEKHELLELWRDSFCHCAGMSDDLQFSAEYEFVSRQSKALITRAHLEMELRLEHAGRSLGNFLEDDLSGAYLGLSPAARAHLDRFRSFLQSFYVGKYGYWPPTRVNPSSAALPKTTFKAMYFEFRNLYEYLVDPTSSTDLQSDRPADGGICVLQNIIAFDRRKRYTSLPHPLPLIPEASALAGQNKANAVRKLFKHSQAQKAGRRAAALAALCAATNPSDIKVMECSLVREYLRFEKSWTLQEKDDSVSCSDARKVRWILIYAILQTLISVTRAPSEVRDTEGVPYPLCCQVAGTPPWDDDGKKAAQKKIALKQRLIAMGQAELRNKAKELQKQHPSNRPPEAIEVPEGPRVAFTTPFLELKPDHADLFIPKPMPLFSSSLPNNRNNSFAPPQYSPPPVPATKSTPSSPTRPRALTIPHKISLVRDLSLRSPQPQRPGFVDSLIHKYSRDRVPSSPNTSPSHSASNSAASSRNVSAPSSGNSSPGGASFRRGNASPISSTPVSSSAREEDSSAWSESSNDEDGMEHASVCGSVSSKYEACEEAVVLNAVGEGARKGVKRWDSVRSVGQLGRSNPEVDAYVWGAAR